MIGRDRDQAYGLVGALADQFEAYHSRYMDSGYVESQARLDFIDKFWMALGWDVTHTEQRNPYMQEVLVEQSQPVEQGRKRPDYTFYIAPEFREAKFFVEAKRPGVPIGEIDPLVQAIRYGYSAGLPFVILHNFSELIIVESRTRPDPATAKSRIIQRFDYRALRDASQFDKIYYLLSREAIAGGSIPAFVDALPGPKRKATQHGLFQGGYRQIDTDFLESLEEWRAELAKALKNKNAWLDGPALTEVVQRILDRLVMLRFLEDKGIETRIGIANLAADRNAWGNFQRASHQLDSVYNGIVYKRHPIVDGTKLEVNEDVFTGICDELDPRDSDYDFAQIPIQILGSIYERFLGKVIVATDKRAHVEDRPEVRKAGGIYYTPTHIVHSIVDDTLGPLVDGKTFGELKNIRVIDPACGSGSFLIAAFDTIVRAAAAWFNANPDKARAAKCIPADDGGWRLSLALKRELLVSCIYGMDLDQQAIEVAQLSLSLKLLADESASSAMLGQQEIEQTLLPSLTYNVVCGNALIDRDFYDDEMFPTSDLRLHPTPFKRTFAKVFDNGGFSAVVGNPPYLFITEISKDEKDYFNKRYKTPEYRFDIYGLFIERAVTEVLKKSGRLGFIIPHTLLANDSFAKLRALLLKEGYVTKVTDIGPGVFQGASNETMILVYENAPAGRRKTTVTTTTARKFPEPDKQFTIAQRSWESNPNSSWLVSVDEDGAQFIEAMRSAKHTIGEFCTVNQGLRTGDNEKYLADSKKGKLWEPVAGGAEVQRYQELITGMWVLYDPELLDAPRRRELFDRDEKIVVQEIRNISLERRIVATLDRKRTFCLQSTNVIGLKPDVDSPKLEFLLGVLNSNLMNQYFRLMFPANNHIASNQLASLPIPEATEKEQERMATMVDALLSAETGRAAAMSEDRRSSLNERCRALEEKIEEMVAALFGVTAVK